MTDTRMFPIQSHVLPSIPWAMIEPHAKQALENHGQDLSRLAERGGLSPAEAVAILKDREYTGPWFILPRDREARDRHEQESARELDEMIDRRPSE